VVEKGELCGGRGFWGAGVRRSGKEAEQGVWPKQYSRLGNMACSSRVAASHPLLVYKYPTHRDSHETRSLTAVLGSRTAPCRM
jgi:hypothetical protein